MTTTKVVTRKIKAAVLAIDDMLCMQGLPEQATMSRKQLTDFRQRLQRMLSVVTEAIPTTELPRLTGMGRVIIDSWPLDCPAGNAILAAEHAFIEYLQDRK